MPLFLHTNFPPISSPSLPLYSSPHSFIPSASNSFHNLIPSFNYTPSNSPKWKTELSSTMLCLLDALQRRERPPSLRWARLFPASSFLRSVWWRDTFVIPIAKTWTLKRSLSACVSKNQAYAIYYEVYIFVKYGPWVCLFVCLFILWFSFCFW